MHPADPAAAATPLLLGIDLGGTKSAALIGTPQGEVLLRRSGPTPAREGPDAVTALLVRLAREVLAEAPGPVAGIGVSAGAPSDARTGRVFEAPNLPGWGHDEGIPLADRLSAALDGLPVALENDANATALAEHRFGAGRGAADMAFLTVGTGFGAGLILQNRLFRGATERAERSATSPWSRAEGPAPAASGAAWKRTRPARPWRASPSSAVSGASRPVRRWSRRPGPGTRPRSTRSRRPPRCWAAASRRCAWS
jgi:hypothetical protein